MANGYWSHNDSFACNRGNITVLFIVSIVIIGSLFRILRRQLRFSKITICKHVNDRFTLLLTDMPDLARSLNSVSKPTLAVCRPSVRLMAVGGLYEVRAV